MKKLLAALIITACSYVAKAQDSAPEQPQYIKKPTIPSFTLTKAPDSTEYKNDSLPKNTATIIMVFSPDCGHCQHEVKELLTQMDLFKKVLFVMASPLDYNNVKKFYEEYKIADYPNIIMGRDVNYRLGSFYDIRNFPSLYLYDKKGKFVKFFDGSIPVEKIAESL